MNDAWDRPRTVGAERFLALSHSSAARWGVQVAGVRRDALPDRRDGVDLIGFSRRLPRAALGVAVDYIVEVYRRGPPQCTVRRRPDGSSRRTCRPGRLRLVGRRTVERDLTINARQPWEQGPVYPSRREVDLETTLIHELGHHAGRRHVGRCVNSPMMVSLAPGEWWRGPRNWYRRGCRASTWPGRGRRRGRKVAGHGRSGPAPSVEVRRVTVGRRVLPGG